MTPDLFFARRATVFHFMLLLSGSGSLCSKSQDGQTHATAESQATAESSPRTCRPLSCMLQYRKPQGLDLKKRDAFQIFSEGFSTSTQPGSCPIERFTNRLVLKKPHLSPQNSLKVKEPLPSPHRLTLSPLPGLAGMQFCVAGVLRSTNCKFLQGDCSKVKLSLATTRVGAISPNPQERDLT